MNPHPRDPFKYARVVSISRKLNAHLHQPSRNKIAEANEDLRKR